MNTIQITSQGIRKALRNVNYLEAISEYIWNGFDAKASVIEIKTFENVLGGIEEIHIKDNGYGINYHDLDYKFKPFLESEKQVNKNTLRNSAVHGKNGIGRLTFFQFASAATWETIFSADSSNQSYSISVKDESLNTYIATDTVETKDWTGTTVIFTEIHEKDIKLDKLSAYICEEFCWFLELNSNKDFQIVINGKKLDYSYLIGERDSFDIDYSPTNTSFALKYIRWEASLKKEYSKIYLLNLSDNEVTKINTRFNHKGDSFYHSVYVKSEFFNDFDFETDESDLQLAMFGNSKRSNEYKYLISEINKYLKSKRKPFLKKYTDTIIKDLKRSSAFPRTKSTNAWDIRRDIELESVVRGLYQVEPKLFLKMNTEQKKTFVRFLDLIMDSDERTHLFTVLDEIIELDSDEKEELADILKSSKLSGVIKTIKLVQDRYTAIEQLRDLVFKADLKANERDHIQKMIERHYWVFGEQYHLVTAAEPRFEEALRRFTHLLSGNDNKRVINHRDKNREMDIFMVRQEKQVNVIKNVVVELKSPSIKLGSKEFHQVEKYLEVILSENEFNANNMEWEFILIGNDFDKTGYINRHIQSNQHHGERSLAQKVGNYKIYVKKWSEVFNEFELRHSFLNEKLNIERAALLEESLSANQIINKRDSNTSAMSGQYRIPVIKN
ncbi:ATP-binding protein [Alkalihalobacillus sp. AL-G]|uniref:ATP-binding protein n=1 Tax=Alkalihalobacillus sp. AL-G TaxID=2926399 RepID=UPI00272A9736|nr:ATP-binding protein [Alkalihalobacillus sp. AL-G]WLD93354.1 ATP-binding protein [Alkalihalobacillus sp. AL-G]